VLIGLTNMPPMANGGMQRGVYGRAESPYNPAYLAAAYVSGSSNGSGVSTATSMAAFGLGEETWSSGRAPASNNSLVAYTPSRGMISTRGNWPLTPTMDVVVPQTRTVSDLLELLEVLVQDDPETRGDLWRRQPWITLPRPSDLRPKHFSDLVNPRALDGKRVGVPRMYINRDFGADIPIQTHPDIIALWERSRQHLESLGAEVVEVDFPAVSNYEQDRAGAQTPVERGIIPEGFLYEEMHELTAWALEDFLAANDDPRLRSLIDVEGSKIYPVPEGTLSDSLGIYHPAYDIDMAMYVDLVRAGLPGLSEFTHLEAGMRGLEVTRRIDFEEWMDEHRLDSLVFPAAADIGHEDAERNEESYRHSWLNGVGVSNGNLVPRHYGIPTVTIPMGVMASTGMPVGVTFAGRAYEDWNLLAFGGAFEAKSCARIAPQRTPALPPLPNRATPHTGALEAAPELHVDASLMNGSMASAVELRIQTAAVEVIATVRGDAVRLVQNGNEWRGTYTLPAQAHEIWHSQWREPYGSLITVIASQPGHSQAGWFGAVGGIV
jgi:amidase